MTRPRVYCVVYGCMNSSTRKPELSFFRLPTTDVERRFKWLRLISREDLARKAAKNYTVCEEHFNTHDILPGTYRKKLKGNSIPSLNLPELQKKDEGTLTEAPTFRDKCMQTEETVILSTRDSIQISEFLSSNTPRKRKLKSDKNCRKQIKLHESLPSVVELLEVTMEPGVAVSGCCEGCLSKDRLNILHNPLGTGGAGEISDMIRKCFNLKIGSESSDKSSYMCDTCIMRLKVAYDFKLQVLRSQQYLHNNTEATRANRDAGTTGKGSFYNSNTVTSALDKQFETYVHIDNCGSYNEIKDMFVKTDTEFIANTAQTAVCPVILQPVKNEQESLTVTLHPIKIEQDPDLTITPGSVQQEQNSDLTTTLHPIKMEQDPDLTIKPGAVQLFSDLTTTLHPIKMEQDPDLTIKPGAVQLFSDLTTTLHPIKTEQDPDLTIKPGPVQLFSDLTTTLHPIKMEQDPDLTIKPGPVQLFSDLTTTLHPIKMEQDPDLTIKPGPVQLFSDLTTTLHPIKTEQDPDLTIKPGPVQLFSDLTTTLHPIKTEQDPDLTIKPGSVQQEHNFLIQTSLTQAEIPLDNETHSIQQLKSNCSQDEEAQKKMPKLEDTSTSDEEDCSFTCEVCFERLLCNSYYMQHLKQYHYPAISCYDKKCNRLFHNHSQLGKHMKLDHSKNSPGIDTNVMCFKCNTCNARFVSRDDLDAHLTSTHFPSKPCNFCDRLFFNDNQLRKHTRTEHPKRKYIIGRASD